MDKIFADTSYWIALLYPSDELHQKANMISEQLDPQETITTELVLAEFLNHVGRMGQYNRMLAANKVTSLQRDPYVDIVPVTSQQFWEAAQLYSERLDQRWSLIDCSSFLIMEQEGITEALTSDRDFEAAGFRALLRDDQ